MRASQGKTFTTQEATKLEMEAVDLRAERAVITLQVWTHSHLLVQCFGKIVIAVISMHNEA